MDKTISRELERVSEGQQRDKYETSSKEMEGFNGSQWPDYRQTIFRVKDTSS